LVIIAPAKPAALAVSDPRSRDSCGSYRRLKEASRPGRLSLSEALILALTVPNESER
jgi:hypothetical protein